jgi:hypothetical protein
MRYSPAAPASANVAYTSPEYVAMERVASPHRPRADAMSATACVVPGANGSVYTPAASLQLEPDAPATYARLPAGASTAARSEYASPVKTPPNVVAVMARSEPTRTTTFCVVAVTGPL